MTSGPRRPHGGSSDAAGFDAGYAWVMLALGTVLVALNLGALSNLAVFLEPLSEVVRLAAHSRGGCDESTL